LKTRTTSSRREGGGNTILARERRATSNLKKQEGRKHPTTRQKLLLLHIYNIRMPPQSQDSNNILMASNLGITSRLEENNHQDDPFDVCVVPNLKDMFV
jgi:hypothetical protein